MLPGALLAAALGFTVGPAHELRPPVLAGSPVEAPAPATTRRYHAVRVRSLSRRGRALAAVLSTDDPNGRTVSVRVAPGPPGTIALDARVRGRRLREVSAVSAAFASPRGEAFHGFGGRRESTNLRGRSFLSWVLDYRYPDASTGYYAPQTSFVSSRGYGAYLATDRIARWRLGSPRWRVSVAGASFRLVVARGGARRAIRALTAITGRHRVAPAWSLGPTLSRTYGVIDDTPARYRAEVEADVARLERGGLPVSAYAFEGWGGMPRELVASIARRLRAKGIHTILYLRSFAANDTAGTEPRGTFEDAVSHGYVAATGSGAPFLIPSPFPGAPAAVVDFTNPAAVRWWRARVAALLDTGADGFMNDFGEQVLPAMHFHDGETGTTMHNRYPVLQARVTRAAVRAWEARHPGRRVYFFQRAGFSGRPGSPASESAEFPGDETVDWQRATGLPSIVPDMLNRAVGGAPGFTTDIGGYAQFTAQDPIMPPTSRELFVRWSEAAALTPFFRVHNSGLDGVRMPWDFDRATLRAWIAMARLHRRAEPLILRLWRSFVRTGIPMTRPLWLADPAGARGPRGDDEWLLGDDVLVAPVLRQGARSRRVRLPPGCWRLHGTGTALRGARTLTARAPLDSLPWYARCGTAPFG
jgi:alpha-glucosidase